METKQLSTQLTIKAVDFGTRTIVGYAAIHNNIDKVNDIIVPTASAKAVARLRKVADVDVFIGHMTHTLPVGIPTKIVADATGLYTETRVFDGPDGDNLLAVAKGLQQHGRTLGMSIGFIPLAYEDARERGRGVRKLMDYTLREYSFAASSVIANPLALVTTVKTTGGIVFKLEERDGKYVIVKTDNGQIVAEAPTREGASMLFDAIKSVKAGDDAGKSDKDDAPAAGASGVNALPNSAFMYVEAGDDDEAGKRVPRSKRHFPVRDKDGNLDAAGLRAALSEIPKSSAPGLSDAQKEALTARVRRMLETMGGDKDGKAVAYEEREEWKTGAPLLLDYAAYQLHDIAVELVKQASAMKTLGQDVKDYARIPQDLRFRIDDLVGKIKDVVAYAEYLDKDEDGSADVANKKRQLELLAV